MLLFLASSSTTIQNNNNSNNCVLGFAPPVPSATSSRRTIAAVVVKSNLNSVAIPLNYARGGDDNTDDLIPQTQTPQAQSPSLPSSSSSPKKFASIELESSFTSPVLKQVYVQLLEWKEKYGHPNVPLKNDGGKACNVLRRLHVQKKLTDDEVEWLDSIRFKFHSFEDIYRFANFDEMLIRLIEYEKNNPNNNFQVPKKCPEDPELGAWVTGIRRLGMDGINPDHERQLTEIQFTWKSTRQCGSKFMIQYRDYVEQVELKGRETILNDPSTTVWIQAQQQALKRGTLSQTRVQYMGEVFGDRWTTIGNKIIDNK
ncbi:MAG: hypothetical protein ACI90V_002873 [Bacillariaceae sp.]|jgi:hypothetical protein